MKSEYHQGQDNDVDVNKNNEEGSRFSRIRRHGRFTFPSTAAVFVGTALLLNTAAIVFSTGFGCKGSLRSMALEKNEDKIDNSLEVVGDGSKKMEASIPQVLWQTAKSHNAPADVAKIMSTWSSLNPNLDQRLLDDFEVLSFMMQHFNSSVAKAFHDLPLPVMRADFFRLAVMYHEGGIYADVDVSSEQLLIP